MDLSSGLLRNILFLVFSVSLIFSCGNSTKRESLVIKTSDSVFGNLPKAESFRIRKSNPHVYSIMISGMAFQPKDITVNKGDTIKWINQDLVNHCVTEIRNNTWASPPIPSGGSWKMVVTQSSDYYCAIHPVMKGRIIVK
jgi:plastocyanin